MDRLQNTGQDTYRLIVTRRNGSEVLLSGGGNAWSLPSVGTSQGRRLADQLSAKLYAQAGFRAYCLFVPTLAAANGHCAVMEVPGDSEIASAETCWRPLNAATYLAMESADDRTVIERALAEWDECLREPSQAPFARPGWLAELFAWVEQQLAPLGLHLTGRFRQLNAAPSFSLIQLETNESAVWFKATGEPNRHELGVTTCVARLFPGSVPEMLGIHAAWNGWLMREAPGSTLDDVPELAEWLQTAESLARLQIGSIGREAQLLDGGCMDLRLPRLIGAVDSWIDCMRVLMAAQQKQTPAPLTDLELTLLGGALKEACSCVSEIGVPATLGHIDFNPGNIVVSPGRYVFLDWAEACVTNPFVTFEYLREHFRRNCTQARTAMESLNAAYMRRWRAQVSPDDLERAALFSSLVAVFAYAVATSARHSFDPRGNSSEGAYFRSLARRMFGEARQIMERSDRCLA
jgi:hypothetical protein